jgi:hypothetical protein
MGRQPVCGLDVAAVRGPDEPAAGLGGVGGQAGPAVQVEEADVVFRRVVAGGARPSFLGTVLTPDARRKAAIGGRGLAGARRAVSRR